MACTRLRHHQSAWKSARSHPSPPWRSACASCTTSSPPTTPTPPCANARTRRLGTKSAPVASRSPVSSRASRRTRILLLLPSTGSAKPPSSKCSTCTLPRLRGSSVEPTTVKHTVACEAAQIVLRSHKAAASYSTTIRAYCQQPVAQTHTNTTVSCPTLPNKAQHNITPYEHKTSRIDDLASTQEREREQISWETSMVLIVITRNKN
mmetsp:Transcript_23468/g.65511  ORF Transcript_23468/g.65511 Transcript_23468/m.65511 type:complete len:207 (+) Transcript_23468:5961-6581(+)